MDAATIQAVEASIYAAGYPTDAAAILLIDLDGAAAGLDEDAARVSRFCTEAGARGVRIATDAADRTRLWQGRKKAFGAMGRLAPHLVVQDAVVPRTRLPEILATIDGIGRRHGVQVCNVFHAGDGNLHPNMAYDGNDPEQSARVHAAMSEIMDACIAAGGTITGEHGIGLDKLPYMDRLFTPETAERDVRPAQRIRSRTTRESRQGRPRALLPRMARRAGGAHAAGVSTDAPPLDALAVAATIRDARAARTSLRIVGGGTWLDAGRPVHADATLALSSLRGVTQYEPGDFTLTVRAGTPLGEIAEIARREGQWLTLQPCRLERWHHRRHDRHVVVGTAGLRVRHAARSPARLRGGDRRRRDRARGRPRGEERRRLRPGAAHDRCLGDARRHHGSDRPAARAPGGRSNGRRRDRGNRRARVRRRRTLAAHDTVSPAGRGAVLGGDGAVASASSNVRCSSCGWAATKRSFGPRESAVAELGTTADVDAAIWDRLARVRAGGSRGRPARHAAQPSWARSGRGSHASSPRAAVRATRRSRAVWCDASCPRRDRAKRPSRCVV